MATTATVTVWATVTATTVTTMARGLLMLSPAMATTDMAMVLDTVMATMADMVTILARGLLRPSLRLPLPLLPRLMLSPAMVTTVMATTATVTVWATVTATTVTTMARGLLMLSPAMATTVTDTAIPTTAVDTTTTVKFWLSDNVQEFSC